MKTSIICTACFAFIITLASCKDECRTCTYYEEDNDGTIVVETPLSGEYCGDEYRALEKKEYTPSQGDDAYTLCE